MVDLEKGLRACSLWGLYLICLPSLVESSVLQLDETEEKVRAIPEKRCVLILREIPKDTPKEASV